MRRGYDEQVEIRHVARISNDFFPKDWDRIEFGDQVLVKNFMSHGRNIGDVIMTVTMHTCNRVQLESQRLGFQGWFPMDSNRLERIEN